MKKQIRLSLDVSSIDNALREIEAYKKFIAEKTQELTRRLAEIGLEQASVLFAGAMYKGTNDVECSIESTERGYKVIAKGATVWFIEFGTGVFYNKNEAYPGVRPPGVLGIGEYGQGKGKRMGWVYLDESGERQFTQGNPPAAAMFNASEKIKKDVLQICREVFSS